jgi:hypothetical protein
MKKIILLYLICCVTFLSVNAQQDKTSSVQATIDQLFDGMRASDSLLLKAVLYEEVTLRTIATNEGGENFLQKADIKDFIKTVGTKRPDAKFDERLNSYEIKIDGDMAMAWTPYVFYFNDKFSHCGVNIFTLMNTASGWKITGITDTRRKTGCE